MPMPLNWLRFVLAHSFSSFLFGALAAARSSVPYERSMGLYNSAVVARGDRKFRGWRNRKSELPRESSEKNSIFSPKRNRSAQLLWSVGVGISARIGWTGSLLRSWVPAFP